MKILGVLIAAFALTSGASAADGFYESRVLIPAASFVASKPVTVYCANSPSLWRDYYQRFVLGSYAGGLTYAGSSETHLNPEICRVLRTKLRKREADTYQLAVSILSLVHESIHMRGEQNEGVTDCAAVHEMPRVAVRFFGVKPGKELRALMGLAWASRERQPPGYLTVC